MTIYELRAISGLDDETISIALPFIQVGEVTKERINWKEALKSGKHDLLLRYQRVPEIKAGYREYEDSVLNENPNKVYQGDPNRYYLRYRYLYKNKLSYGLTADKDAGETFFRADNTQGFDFYSAHIMVKDLGPFKKIIFGDYHATFGQGLNIWTGFNMGRTVQPLKVKQNGTGLKPYTSANESQFFRGVGMTMDFNRFETSFFGSYKKLDADLNVTDTLDEEYTINSFRQTGYHRTLAEINAENTTGELVFGTATSFQTEAFKFNVTGLYSKYSNALTNYQNHYSQFEFSGSEQLSLGADYQYIFPGFSFFGEVSAGLNRKINMINGLLWRVDSKLNIIVVHRYLDKENQNLYGNNFTRSSQNGQGIYVGVEANLTAKLKLKAFYDQSRSNWFRYLVNGPSVERIFLGQLDYAINRYSQFYIRVRSKLNERNISQVTDIDIKPQAFQNSQSIRIHYSQQVNPVFAVKSRIELSSYQFNDTRSRGLLIYQDVVYSPKKIPVRLYGRYALFDTDDYSSRIYAYENDLLYVFSVPGLFYKGFRTYIMAKYEVSRRIDVWLRWSRTSYANRNVISSGLEQIDGHFKSEVKIQAKIRF